MGTSHSSTIPSTLFQGQEWDFAQIRPGFIVGGLSGVPSPLSVSISFGAYDEQWWKWSINFGPYSDRSGKTVPFNLVVHGREKDQAVAVEKAEKQLALLKRTGEFDTMLAKAGVA